MKITKKELFKFCDENNDAINELQSQSDSTDFLLAVLIQQLKDSGVIDEISPEPKPQLKQLDQSVFNGLDEKWKSAATNTDGKAYLHNMPKSMMYFNHSSYGWCSKDYDAHEMQLIGDGFDPSGFAVGFIERDIAKEPAEVDLSSELTGSDLTRAMLARGDKYISGFGHHHSDRLALESKFADTVSKHTQCFQSSQNAWDCFVPINNQGEPLTASEVGL